VEVIWHFLSGDGPVGWPYKIFLHLSSLDTSPLAFGYFQLYHHGKIFQLKYSANNLRKRLPPLLVEYDILNQTKLSVKTKYSLWTATLP
jgi:hypothetical protein